MILYFCYHYWLTQVRKIFLAVIKIQYHEANNVYLLDIADFQAHSFQFEMKTRGDDNFCWVNCRPSILLSG